MQYSCLLPSLVALLVEDHLICIVVFVVLPRGYTQLRMRSTGPNLYLYDNNGDKDLESSTLIYVLGGQSTKELKERRRNYVENIINLHAIANDLPTEVIISHVLCML